MSGRIISKLYLRLLCKADINQTYLDWLNDAEVTKHMVTKSSTIEQLEAFYEHISNSANDVIMAIVDIKTDKHIGNIKIGSIDWGAGIADVGIMIGDKAYWNKGYGTEAIKRASEYAIYKLGLHMVFAGISDENIGSIRAFTKAGYSIGELTPAGGHWYWYETKR